ncbi:MAG: hypothetical protein HQL01_09555 [Nitrospirae bacterium]|nr:hypothetical protein [Nitrospirota bacterium]
MKDDNPSDTNLNGLIARIKVEAVDKVSRESEEILRQASEKAAEIVSSAHKEAGSIVANAHAVVKNMEETSLNSIELAARDIIISVRASLAGLFDLLLTNETRQVLSGKTLETLLFRFIEVLAQGKDSDTTIEVLMSEEDTETLMAGLLSSLKEKIKTGITLKAHPRIGAGFKIGIKGENYYYDLTDEAIAEIMSERLGPKLSSTFDSLLKNKS